MATLLLAPLCLAAVSLLALRSGGPSEPVVEPTVRPAGYLAVTDATYGYAVPSSYAQNPAWTDQNGDFFYGTARAFAAETLVSTQRPPGPRAAPPAAFDSFGASGPVVSDLGPARRIAVSGTEGAWERTVTRPGGWHGVAVDAWEPSSTHELIEIWLLVKAPAEVTRTVLSSLQGSYR